jgi:hypothetical protein
MTRLVLASLLAVSLVVPVLAANEKPGAAKSDINPAKGKGWHCRKLAYERYHVADGRALNNAIGPAIERCRQHGPSAL